MYVTAISQLAKVNGFILVWESLTGREPIISAVSQISVPSVPLPGIRELPVLSRGGLGKKLFPGRKIFSKSKIKKLDLSPRLVGIFRMKAAIFPWPMAL